jgi:hypothetical protein
MLYSSYSCLQEIYRMLAEEKAKKKEEPLFRFMPDAERP